MKLKPEIKTKWLEALRSGDYEQGRSQLRTGDNFCCLGVLTDICIQESDGDIEWRSPDTTPSYDGISWQGGFLSSDVTAWAFNSTGQDHEENPRMVVYDDVRTLTSLNDDLDDEYDFKKIADLIEEQL